MKAERDQRAAGVTKHEGGSEIVFDDLVVCEGLEVRYGPVVALRGIDVAIPAEGLTVVIGPNGAGKTTFLKALCGLEHPSAGRVLLDDAPVERATPEEMLGRGLALVPEGRHVFPHLTVEDNLVLGAFRFRRDRKQTAALLDDVFTWFPRLAERRGQHAGTLSGGEQQMLAIGRALMSRPRLLCLDEPSLGLAPRLVKELFGLLRRLRDAGMTILLVEQFANLALQAADHAYLFENGEVVRSGSGPQLIADPLVRRSYLGIREA